MNPAIEGKLVLAIDRERVTCLLLINTQLLKKAVNIYTNILTNQQTMQQISPQNKHSVVELYQNCTRRLHCNLAVLSFIHEKYHLDPSQQTQQSKAQFPIIMSAPQDMPELNQLYGKLQELYPEALQFLKMKIQQMKQHAQNQYQQGNSSQHSSSNNSPQVQMQNFPGSGPSAIPPNQMGQMPMPVNNPSHMGNVNVVPQNQPVKDYSQHQQSNAFNPQRFNNNLNINMVGDGLTPQQAQAISPQQILLQMHGDLSSNNMNLNENKSGRVDFF